MEGDIIALEAGGMRRECKLFVPRSYRGGMAIALHGAGGNWGSIEEVTGLTERAETEGFAVAYPDGTGSFKGINTWNAGFCCGHAHREGVDDIAFLRGLIDHLEEDHSPHAVLVAGVSNGGMMAHRIAAEARIDAIVAVAASVGGVDGGETYLPPVPDRGVSALIVHGTADGLVPYDGGAPRVEREGGAGSYLSVARSARHWVEANGCSPVPEVSRGEVVRERYTGGRGGSVVEVITVPGGGHCWPGGRSRICGGDEPSRVLSATDEVVRLLLSLEG